MIVNDILVTPWCEGSHGDVQIQGVVQDADEMELSFGDSRSVWTNDSPDHIVDEALPGKRSDECPVHISAATIIIDEHVPNLPPSLLLMDTGCGHDLVNDQMADEFPVKTLKKHSRIMFSTANGRIESRNVVPFGAKS